MFNLENILGGSPSRSETIHPESEPQPTNRFELSSGSNRSSNSNSGISSELSYNRPIDRYNQANVRSPYSSHPSPQGSPQGSTDTRRTVVNQTISPQRRMTNSSSTSISRAPVTRSNISLNVKSVISNPYVPRNFSKQNTAPNPQERVDGSNIKTIHTVSHTAPRQNSNVGSGTNSNQSPHSKPRANIQVVQSTSSPSNRGSYVQPNVQNNRPRANIQIVQDTVSPPDNRFNNQTVGQTKERITGQYANHTKNHKPISNNRSYSHQEDDQGLNLGNTYTFSELPEGNTWQLVPLYRMTAVDVMSVWQIGFDGSQLVIIHGHIGGAKQIKTREVITNTSGRNLQEQAILEARQRYWSNYHKGYRPAEDAVPLCLTLPEPMLANKYEDKKIKFFPVCIQAKIDGVRSLATLDSSGKTTLRSRTNHQQPYLEHIKEQLETFFVYLPPGSHLDGELYSVDMGFNELISAVRTTKRKHARNKDVNYYIFDIIVPLKQDEMVFVDRYDLLNAAYNRYLEDGHQATSFLVLRCDVAYSHQEIKDYHDSYVQQGYEGAIVRKLGPESTQTSTCKGNTPKDSIYRSSRCNNLLKVKNFIDEEGIVRGVNEGTGTEKGLAILVVEDMRGNVFPLRPRGTFETRKYWYDNPHLCIGKRYTFRYFELTKDNIPRFPVGISFRDYE